MRLAASLAAVALAAAAGIAHRADLPVAYLILAILAGLLLALALLPRDEW